MNKIRHLFITSFRWRILINISVSYIIAIFVYVILSVILTQFNIFNLSVNLRDVISFLVAMIIFITVFLKLIDMNFHYIDLINEKIQQVTLGDYDTYCEIEYDDELGMVAANINALANTLKEKENESNILKENERVAYEAERRSEIQKNEMITNIAHDLRTPLTTIMGYLELMKNNPDLSSEKIQEYSTTAYDKSLRLKSMMDDLFTYTKIDSPDMKMDIRILNINELLFQMEDEFYPSLEEHHVHLLAHIPDEPLLVLGDGQLLARVFENLISNALKYGYDNSSLMIDVIADEQNITIKIINEGDTIDKSDIPYLFDKFYRTDASRGTTQGGTGLGLAITKSIVEMHKGQVLVTSKDNFTTFIVILKRYNESMT